MTKCKKEHKEDETKIIIQHYAYFFTLICNKFKSIDEDIDLLFSIVTNKPKAKKCLSSASAKKTQKSSKK
jgi:hypothetical protein